MYYVLTENPDPYPPVFDIYLNKLGPKIGAEVKWTNSSDTVYDNFAKTGKSIISRTFPTLMYLINSTRRLDAKFATPFRSSDQRRSTSDIFLIGLGHT